MADSSSLVLVQVSNVETKARRQYGPGMWVEAPARGEFTGLALRRLTKASLASGLKTPRPTKVVLMTDKEGKQLYLIPVASHPEAISVRYSRNRAIINLSKLFAQIDRSVAQGMREFHPVELLTEPVMFEGKEHWAVVMPLLHTMSKRKRSGRSAAKAALGAVMVETAATKE